MKHRKLEKTRVLGGIVAVVAGVHLAAPIIVWFGLWQFRIINQTLFDWSLIVWIALAIGGLVCLYIGMQDRRRSRFIGEVETFTLGTPIFGETLPVMCVVPARRDIQISGASALLFWDEFAIYDKPQGREFKNRRLLLTEHHAGDGAFRAGDVLRHEITLLLPASLPEDLWGANWRTAHRVRLVLQLCVNIDHCPDIREEYEVAILEKHGT